MRPIYIVGVASARGKRYSGRLRDTGSNAAHEPQQPAIIVWTICCHHKVVGKVIGEEINSEDDLYGQRVKRKGRQIDTPGSCSPPNRCYNTLPTRHHFQLPQPRIGRYQHSLSLLLNE